MVGKEKRAKPMSAGSRGWEGRAPDEPLNAFTTFRNVNGVVLRLLKSEKHQ